MLVDLVHVAARGVGLPQLDQRVGHRAAAFVEHLAREDHAFAQRLAVDARVAREVVVELADAVVAVHRLLQLAERGLQRDERLLRAALAGRLVAGVDVAGMGVPVARGEGGLNAAGLGHVRCLLSWDESEARTVEVAINDVN
ncbi:hypothetical protein D9M69_571980 [compost metagenome]